jgi:hypothetical protein
VTGLVLETAYIFSDGGLGNQLIVELYKRIETSQVYLYEFYYILSHFYINRISGVMDSVLTLSAVDCGKHRHAYMMTVYTNSLS